MPQRRKPRSEIVFKRPCREKALSESIQAATTALPADWTPPKKLSARARAEWQRIVTHLEEHKIGRTADRSAVEAAARLWELYSTAVDAVADGLKSSNKNKSEGIEKTATSARLALATIAQLRQLWGALGMTPDSRYRIRAQSDDDKQKAVEDWLFGSERERPLKTDEDY